MLNHSSFRNDFIKLAYFLKFDGNKLDFTPLGCHPDNFSKWSGSTGVVTNAAGAVIAEMRYTPYGETRSAAGTSPTDYLYTSQRQEAGLGLYFYNARWYDPQLARFTQPDTLVPGAGNPKAFDRYAYVQNNPLRYNDPSGHMQYEDPYTESDGVCESGDTSCNWIGQGSSTNTGSSTVSSPIVALQPQDSTVLTPISANTNSSHPPSENRTTSKCSASDLNCQLEPKINRSKAEPPPLSIYTRASTAILVILAFLLADYLSFEVTRLLTVGSIVDGIADPTPLTRAAVAIVDVGAGIWDTALGVAHVEYAHWIVTGKWIKNVDDLTDWAWAP
jgi:RHS repeat-associated protein